MKKIFIISVAIFLFAAVGFSQAVKDRNVIPVAVNLNQVLRMTITNGGNIEFVFNTIDDYKNGLSGDQATSSSANPITSEPFYQTDFTVASSTRWKLTYGSEEATFIGTDNPGNTLTLDNVGFDIVEGGAHGFDLVAKNTTAGAQLWSAPTVGGAQVTALQAYPVVLIEDNDDALANAGDATDNSFTLTWRCGTAEAGTIVPMNATKLIDQTPSPSPDRYVTNVIFELTIDN